MVNTKGQYGQECNITSCQKPNSAFYYNHFNHHYYCAECASRLNNDEFNKRDAERLLGHPMCTLEKERGIKLIDNIIEDAEKRIVDWNFKSGRENRRERRKQNRKK